MPEDIRGLVERSRDGDAVAFEALYERFERSIYALCYHLLGDPDAASDAVQETFVTVFENLRRLRHPEAFATWLRGAAVHACRWHRRKWRRLRSWSEVGGLGEVGHEVPDAGPPPDESLAQRDLGRHVREALAKLSDPHREVIVLHHLEGLPLVEIADTLGVAEGTVKSRLGRARQHLERLLEPYVTGGE